MEAKSTDRKHFQLIDNGTILGELAYSSLLSFKAEIKLANSTVYSLKPHGFFETSITVSTNGTDIAHLKMNWYGHIVIAFEDGQEFLFKAKGIFQQKFIIENKDGQKIIHIAPHFNWSKFNYNYEITFDNTAQDTLLILLAIYASNYYIDSMTGSVAGMS
ncbi:hypothetical protein [Paraflavitalea sp. CAU 1676]|uniref:hypothetical protein n=1 Tax=Paraflavitalea sp. CAU 1676 TaxID=3032598 RepID=UPI0023DB07CF|nr:hypothetical protein [Paraflavitalea sp. CAU 1676]MDF2193450.1 hypothetical protein [Paraflavitalea sp. CAU 1676]